LYDPEIDTDALPRLAIRPYPSKYLQHTKLRDGTEVIIRPIRPEDERLIAKFHETLSDQSVYLRYFHPMALKQRVAHDRLSRICFIDYDREMVLVVEEKDPANGEDRFIAVGRLNKLRGINDAEFAILISDDYQRSGLGTMLLDRLVQIGRAEKVDRIVADILTENRGMQRACEKVGFKLRFDQEEQVVKAVIELQTDNQGK
jgi:acetyltransferase